MADAFSDGRQNSRGNTGLQYREGLFKWFEGRVSPSRFASSLSLATAWPYDFVMRLAQLSHPQHGRRVATVPNDQTLRLLREARSVYDLVDAALAAGLRLNS